MGPWTENLQPVNFSEMSHNLSEPRPSCMCTCAGTRSRPRVAVGLVSKALIDVRLWASTPPLCLRELVPRGLKSESCRATPCHLDTADLGAGLSARTAEATKCRATTLKLQLRGEGQHTFSFFVCQRLCSTAKWRHGILSTLNYVCTVSSQRAEYNYY